MSQRITITIVLMLLLGVVPPLAAQAGTALRIRVRDLADQGVAGVTLTLRDGEDQAQTVATASDGTVQITGLPGAWVRLVEARSAAGEALVMDENDPAGGLRIPLRQGQLQVLDLRLTDGLLFVEPAAVTEGPLPTALAQMAPTNVAATPTTRSTMPRPVVPDPTPPAQTPRPWSRWWYAAWALPLLPLLAWWVQARATRRPR